MGALVLKKILISDSCDFFSLTLKDSLQKILNDNYTVSAVAINTIEQELKRNYFDHLVLGVNNNSESEIHLAGHIRKNYSHANIVIVAQDLDIEHIKKLKVLRINSILLKPVNIDHIIERLGI